MDLKTSALERHGSAREIGRKLHDRLPPRLQKKWKPESLANQVTKLFNEDTRWWERTGREAVPTLAALLDVETASLLGRVEAQPEELGFPEFPALPPLLPGEPAFSMNGVDVVFSLVATRPQFLLSPRFDWVEASPGCGKSLALRYLRSSTTHLRPEEAATLEDALTMDLEGDVVLAVERASTADASALHELGSRLRSCLVLAPFTPVHLRSLGRGHGSINRWAVRKPAPFLLWRADFADWVVHRLREKRGRALRFDLRGLLRWLEARDPSGVIVASPGDLLALCADFDAHGTGRTTLAKRAERWLSSVGRDRFGDLAPKAWRNKLAARTYGGLLEAQLRELRLSLSETSPRDWERLVPEETSPRKARGHLDAPLVVESFREAGLLRQDERGLLPYPRWVAQGCWDAAIEADLDSPEPEGWGLLAADASRAAIVDGTLDRLSAGTFRRVVRAVTSAFSRTSLGRRAAMEAAFAAAARRLRNGAIPETADVELWQRLVLLQLQNLESRGGSLMPYTRRVPEELLANGWSLSVRLPAGAEVNEGWSWLVPGWRTAPLQLEDAPREVGFPVREEQAADPLSPLRRLCELAPEIVERLSLQEVPQRGVTLLLPAMFADTSRDWPLGSEHLRSLGDYEEESLWRLAHALDDAGRAALASKVWRTLAPEDGTVLERIERLSDSHPNLAGLVLENVPAEALRETVRSGGLHVGRRGAGNPAPLARLHADALDAAIREWAANPSPVHANWAEADSLLEVLDADHVDLVLELVDRSDPDIATYLARFVWRHDVAAARERVRRGPVRHWFWAAPRSELPFIASLVEPPFPAWMKSWAYQRAPEAGPAAERLYALSMATEPEST